VRWLHNASSIVISMKLLLVFTLYSNFCSELTRYRLDGERLVVCWLLNYSLCGCISQISALLFSFVVVSQLLRSDSEETLESQVFSRRGNATRCNTLPHTATHCHTLQHTATRCSTLQHTATHCNTLQHTATHCNTPQHTATHCNTHTTYLF